ncbi:hypothetical protein ACFQZE_06045 [Paenibacillus sp. GCM10027627]|uniref:hypothetical protein n=1 Tax=unclassified Paenibacillus TaxID=185978 RepID=UPI003645CD40
MFNKRSFLLGLGCGIIAGAILLQLFNLGQSSQDRLQEIGREIEQGEGAQPGHSAAAEPSSAASPSSTSSGAQTVTPSATPASTADHVSSSGETSSSAKPEQTKAAEEQERIVIRIEPGTDLTSTGELLVSKGIIEDSAPFIKKMKASKKLIRAGYFLFPKGIGAEEAIKIVTGQPLDKKEADKLASKA